MGWFGVTLTGSLVALCGAAWANAKFARQAFVFRRMYDDDELGDDKKVRRAAETFLKAKVPEARFSFSFGKNDYQHYTDQGWIYTLGVLPIQPYQRINRIMVMLDWKSRSQGSKPDPPR